MTDLKALAAHQMTVAGLQSEFDAAAKAELAQLPKSPRSEADLLDLRALLWSSIDNDDSRDLDQIEVTEALPNGALKVLVGIAEVDSLVKKDSALDRHAAKNTTSVYTGVITFPMLPEVLSTDLTSLNQDADRAAIVTELEVAPDGTVTASRVYRALVRNKAQLAYNGVGAWLAGTGPAPAKVAANPALAEELRRQDAVAQKLRAIRYAHGALDLNTIEANPVMKDGVVTALEETQQNRARELIEDIMIAANTAMAEFISAAGRSVLERVVKEPERWERIVTLAASLHETLPAAASSQALSVFLQKQRGKDPVHFPDLSLSIVKLMGPGEYIVQKTGAAHEGHFGLAVDDYTHSTAPNRRFADLVTQRMLKALLAKAPSPYDDSALAAIATQCNTQAAASRKVERFMRKAAAATLLSHRIGDVFDAIITGANDKGTYARLLSPPAEGRVVSGEKGLQVGDRARVTLTRVVPEKGFIDFAASGGSATTHTGAASR